MIPEFAGLKDETEEQYFKRINIGHLGHAFKLLQKYGRGTMLKYCRERNISADDIDRIEYKFERAFGTKVIKAPENKTDYGHHADEVPF